MLQKLPQIGLAFFCEVQLSATGELQFDNMAHKKLTKEEELLLQDFSRNVTTKSSALFYGNAFIVSAVPICEYSCLWN